MVALEASSAHSGGVTVFYQAAYHFSVEVLCLYGANVVIFQLASGCQQWFIVVFYLDLDESLTIEDVVVATSQRPWETALLVVENFNTNLAAPEGRAQNKEIAAAMVELGLENMSRYFLLQHKPWLKDGQTWDMQ